MKKLYLMVCLCTLATGVQASDITNPFYLPTQGQLGIITSGGFEKNQAKANPLLGGYQSISYDTSVQAEIQYGLTNSVSVVANVGNVFDKTKDTMVTETSDKNLSGAMGLAWNLLKGPTRLQLMAAYNQSNSGYKAIQAEAKTGYQFKTFLPYASVGETFPIDQPDVFSKPQYNAKFGIYQGQCEVWALDTGIRWFHDEFGEQRGWNAEVEASYYLNPQTTLGIWGTYLIDGKAKYDTELRDKAAGVRLRWFLG